MDRLKMHSADKVDENIKIIAELFPNTLTEVIKAYREDGSAIIKDAIDFEVLKQELAHVIVEGPEERYQFIWPDKKKSILLANAPIAKTLRPCREESVDFDTTENLYIEGDSLDALKLLQETYLGRVKMIYIDPPYNTGNDLVYGDDFAQRAEEFLVNSGQLDEEGNRLVQNTESNGRFHTDWLNMIYPRVKLAKDLLSDDGVIFISIDDNEANNLKKICDEIFGAYNFIAQFVWRGGRRNAAKIISTSHEYMLCYAKSLIFCSNKQLLWREPKKGIDAIYKQAGRLVKTCNYDYELASARLKKWYKNLDDSVDSKAHEHYNWIDENGVYFASDISRGGGGGPKWEIKNPKTGQVVKTPRRGWAYSKLKDLEADIKNGLVHFNGDSVPCRKIYLKQNENQLVESVFYKDRRGSSKRLRKLMGANVFDFPKDEYIIKEKIAAFADKTGIIMDFFSGSATTAHAVMELNAEDGGSRKFIMVQLPEPCEEKSEAYKAGYKTIAEIGKERIRRAGRKIMEEYPEGRADTGFRVLKVDSTNMRDVYYHPAEYKQEQLALLAENIKPGRTPEDLLFQVMLDLGVLLSSKIEETIICGKKVFSVADDYLMACFDSHVNGEVIIEIAKKQPYYAVFRDSGLANDSVATNFEQIFASCSPTTIRKVL